MEQQQTHPQVSMTENLDKCEQTNKQINSFYDQLKKSKQQNLQEQQKLNGNKENRSDQAQRHNSSAIQISYLNSQKKQQINQFLGDKQNLSFPQFQQAQAKPSHFINVKQKFQMEPFNLESNSAIQDSLMTLETADLMVKTKDLICQDSNFTNITYQTFPEYDQVNLQNLPSKRRLEDIESKEINQFQTVEEFQKRLLIELQNNEKLQEQILNLQNIIKQKQNESNSTIQKLINQNKLLVKQNSQYQEVIDKLTNQVEKQRIKLDESQDLLLKQQDQIKKFISQSVNISPRNKFMNKTRKQIQEKRSSSRKQGENVQTLSQSLNSTQEVIKSDIPKYLKKTKEGIKSKVIHRKSSSEHYSPSPKIQKHQQTHNSKSQNARSISRSSNFSQGKAEKDNLQLRQQNIYLQQEFQKLSEQTSKLQEENINFKQQNSQLTEQMRKLRLRMLENMFANSYQTTQQQKKVKQQFNIGKDKNEGKDEEEIWNIPSVEKISSEEFKENNELEINQKIVKGTRNQGIKRELEHYSKIKRQRANISKKQIQRLLDSDQLQYQVLSANIEMNQLLNGKRKSSDS